MEIAPFTSLASLARWARDFSASSEQESEVAALSLEMSELDVLLEALVAVEASATARGFIAEAVLQRLYRALDLQQFPPVAIDELTVRSVARVLPAAPALRRLLSITILGVVQHYAEARS
jgi:hypothetical protein